MKISASIVTYNNEREIRGVLNSLICCDAHDNMDIFVVDNCSKDKTIEIVETEYPQVKLIRSPKNGGYGYGHNQAIRITDAKYHFVINPDILFDKNLISDIVDYLEKNEDIVLGIPSILDEDKNLKFPPKKHPKVHYLVGRFLPYKGIVKKWCDEYSDKNKTLTCNKEPFEVEVCSGSFMAMRVDMVKEVGGFDERYFMYFEDMDISRTLGQRGKVMYMPQFEAIHEGKRAGHHSKTARKMLISSMFKYFGKWGWKI